MSKAEDIDIDQFGLHLMMDGYGAPHDLLKDKAKLKHLLDTLPQEMGMYPICDPVIAEVGSNNHKDPGGLSGFVLIAESHISFHTFPARGFVTIDVYTCRIDLDIDAFVKKFTEEFKLQDVDSYVQKRGTKYPRENI